MKRTKTTSPKSSSSPTRKTSPTRRTSPKSSSSPTRKHRAKKPKLSGEFTELDAANVLTSLSNVRLAPARSPDALALAPSPAETAAAESALAAALAAAPARSPAESALAAALAAAPARSPAESAAAVESAAAAAALAERVAVVPSAAENSFTFDRSRGRGRGRGRSGMPDRSPSPTVCLDSDVVCERKLDEEQLHSTLKRLKEKGVIKDFSLWNKRKNATNYKFLPEMNKRAVLQDFSETLESLDRYFNRVNKVKNIAKAGIKPGLATTALIAAILSANQGLNTNNLKPVPMTPQNELLRYSTFKPKYDKKNGELSRMERTIRT